VGPRSSALTVSPNLEVSETIWKNWIINKVQFPRRLMVFIDLSAAITITLETAEMHTNFLSFESRPRRVEVIPASAIRLLSVLVQYWELWHAKLEGGGLLELLPNPDFRTIDILALENDSQGRKIALTIPYQISEVVGFAVSVIAALLLGLMLFNAQFSKSTRRAR